MTLEVAPRLTQERESVWVFSWAYSPPHCDATVIAIEENILGGGGAAGFQCAPAVVERVRRRMKPGHFKFTSNGHYHVSPFAYIGIKWEMQGQGPKPYRRERASSSPYITVDELPAYLHYLGDI
jgi:hypothetical protein